MPYNDEVTASPSPSRSLLLSLALSLSLPACTSACPQGPTTTCWCPGDLVGESTCEDALYGPCVCPGSAVLAPVPAVPAPAPRPTPGLMVPSTIPIGVEPPTS